MGACFLMNNTHSVRDMYLTRGEVACAFTCQSGHVVLPYKGAPGSFLTPAANHTIVCCNLNLFAVLFLTGVLVK